MTVKTNAPRIEAVEATSTLEVLQLAQSRRLRIGLALLAVYIIWGSTYLGMRIALESFPPFLMTGGRFLFAGSLLFILSRLRGAAMPTREEWRNGAIIGTMMLGVGTGGVAFAEQWVDSGLAATAVASVPLWAALWAGFFGQWPNRVEWGCIALGLAGVVLLNLENGLQANPLGALALIVGPVSWACGSILSRRVKLPSGLMAVSVEMLGGGLVLTVFALLLGERITEMPTLRSSLALAYLIIFGAVIAFSAYMYLLGQVRPTLATSYAYVNPMVAVLLGALFAAETIRPLGIAAMGIILAGVALLTLSRQKQIEPPSRQEG